MVRTTGPATRSAHPFLKFGTHQLDVLFSRFWFLTEITQQIHSFRASCVISSHAARASGSELTAFRKSLARCEPRPGTSLSWSWGFILRPNECNKDFSPTIKLARWQNQGRVTAGLQTIREFNQCLDHKVAHGAILQRLGRCRVSTFAYTR
jgi:hypothetical protein